MSISNALFYLLIFYITFKIFKHSFKRNYLLSIIIKNNESKPCFHNTLKKKHNKATPLLYFEIILHFLHQLSRSVQLLYLGLVEILLDDPRDSLLREHARQRQEHLVLDPVLVLDAH